MPRGPKPKAKKPTGKAKKPAAPAKKPVAKKPAPKKKAAPARKKPARKVAVRPAETWEPTGRSWGNDSHFARARELEAQGDLEGARDAYVLAISDEDGGTGCELLLLDILDRLRDTEGVFELAGRLEARGIGSVVMGTSTSRAFTRRGRWQEGIAAAQRAINFDPAYAKAWLALAEANRAGDDYEAAVTAGTELVRLAPDWGWGWFQLATDYHELGRYREARDAAEMAVRLDHQYDAAWYNLACYRARLGDERGALDALETAIMWDATNAAAALKDEDFALLRTHPRFLAMCGAE